MLARVLITGGVAPSMYLFFTKIQKVIYVEDNIYKPGQAFNIGAMTMSFFVML